MPVVIAALLPVFLLIVLGFILKRSLMRLETQWHGLERLTYYVLFPVLLVQTLVKADLSKVPVAGVGGALLLSALAMSLLCLALRPLLGRLAIDGPAFTLTGVRPSVACPDSTTHARIPSSASSRPSDAPTHPSGTAGPPEISCHI